MILDLHPVPLRNDRRSNRGSAALIVLILLLVMASLVIGNNLALDHLHRELQLIEQIQARRASRASTTNAPASGLRKLPPPSPSTRSSTPNPRQPRYK
jgi:hypothetical protein